MQTLPAPALTVSDDALVRADGYSLNSWSKSAGVLSRLRRRLFGISPEEATFGRRGFHAGDPVARERLEQIGRTFLYGYHIALEQPAPAALDSSLGHVELERRGFAFEGAAMALALLDVLTPWCGGRLQRFLAGPGQAHTFMVHVGAGWALARLRRSIEPALRQLDPLLGWLAVDGYGFHEGYFAWPRYLGAQTPPRPLRGFAGHVFDQGLGRSLWFVNGADPGRIAQTVQSLARERQSDLWSGVGLACTYAGGADEAKLMALLSLAGAFSPDMAQGAVFAAGARARAGNPTLHTELACRVFTGMSATEAAALTQSTLVNLPDGPPGVAYATWRCRIRAHFL